MTKSSGHEDRMLKKFMKKSKARGLKEYKKHDFLHFIVKRAMKREKIDINTPNHIDGKIEKKIDDMKRMKEEEKKKMLIGERTRPILVEQLQSKKPVLYTSCQPRQGLMEKEAHFKEVVDVEEEKVVLVSKDVDDDDDYQKEVMNKKTAKKNNKRKNLCKLPVEPPNEEICKLMMEKISEIEGKNPVWLTSKILTNSDQDSGLGRFYIPACDELVKYLRKEELDILAKDKNHRIQCRAVDQNGEMWDLRFRYYGSLKQYAFVGGWKNLLRSFGLLRPKEELEEDVPQLVPGGKIELWCFRLPDKDLSLSFALRITRL